MSLFWPNSWHFIQTFLWYGSSRTTRNPAARWVHRFFVHRGRQLLFVFRPFTALVPLKLVTSSSQTKDVNHQRGINCWWRSGPLDLATEWHSSQYVNLLSAFFFSGSKSPADWERHWSLNQLSSETGFYHCSLSPSRLDTTSVDARMVLSTRFASHPHCQHRSESHRVPCFGFAEFWCTFAGVF